MVLPPADTQAMVVAIYLQLHEGHATNEYLHERAILAPRNKEVLLIVATLALGSRPRKRELQGCGPKRKPGS